MFIHNCQMERQSCLCLVLQSFIWQYLEQYFAILHPPQAFNLNSWLHALQTFGSYSHFIRESLYPLSTAISSVSLKWAWILSLLITQWINSVFIVFFFIFGYALLVTVQAPWAIKTFIKFSTCCTFVVFHSKITNGVLDRMYEIFHFFCSLVLLKWTSLNFKKFGKFLTISG